MDFPVLSCSVPDLPPVGYVHFSRGVKPTTQTSLEEVD